ncbi:hypothetical protein NP493_1041g00011 [Ridgeia piscesae]|uniref:Sushi domain-containing protein n=1 Tax=Ridgeia piscesae TaxID=27915 RepID=A0AAD9KHQ1_RIDPI|nr:hypothetical protein NP493_1041g00011 [Ridgeia piscesae]
MTCTYKGWNVKQVPQCKPKYCGQAPLINNGYVKSSTGVQFGDTVTYKCYGGYRALKDTITCRETGQWEDTPSCTATKCPQRPPINDGMKDTLFGDGVSYGSVVRFTCDDGYEVVGVRWSSVRRTERGLAVTRSSVRVRVTHTNSDVAHRKFVQLPRPL